MNRNDEGRREDISHRLREAGVESPVDLRNHQEIPVAEDATEQLIEAARLLDMLSFQNGRPADGFRFREGIQSMRDALIKLGRAPFQEARSRKKTRRITPKQLQECLWTTEGEEFDLEVACERINSLLGAAVLPESFVKLLELQIAIQKRFEEREPSSGAWAEPFKIVAEVFKEILPLKD